MAYKLLIGNTTEALDNKKDQDQKPLNSSATTDKEETLSEREKRYEMIADKLYNGGSPLLWDKHFYPYYQQSSCYQVRNMYKRFKKCLKLFLAKYEQIRGSKLTIRKK